MLFGRVAKGPLTQRERIAHLIAGVAVGAMLGALLWSIFTYRTSTSGWLGFYVVACMILCAIVGYYAPRWVIELVGFMLMLLTSVG